LHWICLLLRVVRVVINIRILLIRLERRMRRVELLSQMRLRILLVIHILRRRHKRIGIYIAIVLIRIVNDGVAQRKSIKLLVN
jgi:hypothetical protein